MGKIKVFVAGASGFIGRNLTEHLSGMPGRYEVFACTDPVADLRDAEAVRRVIGDFDPTFVINCAAVVGTRKNAYNKDEADVVAANLRIFFNLARAMRPGARMLQLGTGAEYDPLTRPHKTPEEFFDAGVPADQYGFSKYVISKYTGAAGSVTMLRLFGIFGKYEDYTFKFISNAIVKNLLGLPIVINRNVVFDFLYINDFARIAEKFLHCEPKYRHYNVTPTESIDLLSLAERINRVGKQKSEIRVLNPGLNREYTGSNARLLAELPGFKFTPYAEAIRELYSYYNCNLEKLDLDAVRADPYLRNCRMS